MGEVYSHLSEEERQVIQIEIGNGTGVRAMARMLGRNASTISREIKRNTWFPSNESESYRPYRLARLKTGPWTGRYYVAGPAQRKADRRRAAARRPFRLSDDRLVVVGGGAAAPGLVPAADIRKAARGFSRRRGHARVPGDDLPLDLRRWVESRPVGALPAARAPAQAQAWRQEDAPFPDTRTHSDPRTALRSRGSRRLRSLGGRQRHRDGLPSAHRGRAQDPVPHGPHHSRQDGRGEPRRPAVAVLRAAAGRQARRHLRQRHGVRQACRASRRAGDGHLLRRSVQLPAARQQREQEQHDPAIPAQTGRHQPRHDADVQEIVDETDNRPMRELGYRTPAEAFTDELLDLQTKQGRCTYK